MFSTADTLISKNTNWMQLTKSERSKSATKLFDIIDQLVLSKNEAKTQSNEENLKIENENIGIVLTLKFFINSGEFKIKF